MMAEPCDDNIKIFQLRFLKARLQTFTDWPFDENCSCTPQKMAEVGFYHCPSENEPDLVKCFVCLKELDGWEPNDDPWSEHKSHSGKCPFLQYCDPANPRKFTLEDFLKLEKERQIWFVRKEHNKLETAMQDYVKQARQQMESLI